MLACTICGKDLSTTINLRRHFQTCNSRQITENIVLKHEEYERKLREQREYYERKLRDLHEYYERKLREQRAITPQSDDTLEQDKDVVDEYPWKLVRALDPHNI
jgi:hypothetical protein